MRSATSSILTIAALTILSSACGSARPAESARTDWSLLTRAEVEASHHANLYDLIRTTRPSWLRTRGRNSYQAQDPIMIYVDGNRLGGPRVLTTIPPINVRKVRFLGPAEAHARFGLGNTNGAILITTRRG